MLTVTLRHDAGLPLRALRKLVMSAYRRARQRGTVQRIFKAKVRGTIRAVEVTHGSNGWHPHLHILILTDEWTLADTLALELAYEAAIEKEANAAGVSFARVAPKRNVAMRWSSARATDKEMTRCEYMAKLGWELSGAGKGDPQFALAERATREERAACLWREYVASMKGVRAIECDERAAEMATMHALRKQGDVDATVVTDERSVEIGPFRLLRMKDAERVRPTITRDVLIAVASRAGPTDESVYAVFDATLRACYLPPS
jgi:hypothetical protein